MSAIEKKLDGAIVSRKTVHGARTVSMLTLVAALSACAFAPGQRMDTPAQIPVSNGEDGTTAETQTVPITEVNLYTLGQIRKAAAAQEGDVSQLFGTPTPYKMGPGDVLQVTVWDHPELAAALGQNNGTTRNSDPTQGVLVDEGGNIQFPYAGTVHVGGESVDQVQKKLYNLLSRTMVKPQITVRIASFRSQNVYVDGEVHTPGAVSVNDIPMTLSEAVGRAGGYTTEADQGRVTITRGDKTYDVSIPDLLARNINPSKILLKGGDLVRVVNRRDSGVYVMGEVTKPQTVPPQANGRLTLAQAISDANSFAPESADPKALYVIRGGVNGAQPQVWHLDAKSPVSMVLATQFPLEPKDVVYVDSTGLTRFSRVLNQLLPLVNAGLTGAIVTK